MLFARLGLTHQGNAKKIKGTLVESLSYATVAPFERIFEKKNKNKKKKK